MNYVGYYSQPSGQPSSMPGSMGLPYGGSSGASSAYGYGAPAQMVVNPMPATSSYVTPGRDWESALQAAAANVVHNTPSSLSTVRPVSGPRPSTPSTVATVTTKPTTTPSSFKPQRFSFSSRAPRPGSYANTNVCIYCDICKISCSTKNAYEFHLKGSKHLKKAAQAASGENKSSSSTKPGLPLPPNSALYHCELCDVSCTGIDTYNAHLVGKPHKKTLELHKRMGKAIPNIQTPTTPGRSDEKEELSAAPVGLEYVSEERNDLGKVMHYFCKLCDCRFNDQLAKDMHVKGRRHRLQYKKNVDPSIRVDDKPTNYRSRHSGKMTLPPVVTGAVRRSRLFSVVVGEVTPQLLRSEQAAASQLDRHVNVKHSSIAVLEERSKLIHDFVAACERALRCSMDDIDIDGVVQPGPEAATVNTDTQESAEKATKSVANARSSLPASRRMLLDVTRVGRLAKQMLLKTDDAIELVVLAAKWPTNQLLQNVADRLQVHFQAASKDYNVCVDSSIIWVEKEEDMGSLKCQIYVSSTKVLPPEADPAGKSEVSASAQKDDVEGDKVPKCETVQPVEDAVDLSVCLHALTLIRQQQWFQKCVIGQRPCLVVIRVLRDLCRRVETWNPLSDHAIELLVERTYRSYLPPLTVGGVLQRVIESLAAGLLLPGGSGLHDPCEKVHVDAVAHLTEQQCEDITASAQHALRLIMFGKVHKVLDMEPLSKSGKPDGAESGDTSNARKRLLEGSSADDAPASKSIKSE